MADIKITASVRTDFGKGAARRTRRDGQVPAVLYGHGGAPQHIALPGHATFMALKHSNALFQIDVEGAKSLAIVRDVQRDAIGRVIEHVDLLLVRKGEKVDVDVWVNVIGESAPGTIHVLETQALSISADATDLPESVTADITGMVDGDVIYARDIELPAGVELLTDPDQDIVLVNEPRISEADAALDAEELAEEEADLLAAE